MVLVAPRFISVPSLFPPRTWLEPGFGGDLPSGDTGPRPLQTWSVSMSRGPSALSLDPAVPWQPPHSRERLLTFLSSFISPLQGWTLPGARWPLAEAELEAGPPQPPPQEMEYLSAALEEDELKGLGARCPLAPALAEQRQVEGSAQREAKPGRPRGTAVRTALVPSPTILPRHFSP